MFLAKIFFTFFSIWLWALIQTHPAIYNRLGNKKGRRWKRQGFGSFFSVWFQQISDQKKMNEPGGRGLAARWPGAVSLPLRLWMGSPQYAGSCRIDLFPVFSDREKIRLYLCKWLLFHSGTKKTGCNHPKKGKNPGWFLNKKVVLQLLENQRATPLLISNRTSGQILAAKISLFKSLPGGFKSVYFL